MSHSVAVVASGWHSTIASVVVAGKPVASTLTVCPSTRSVEGETTTDGCDLGTGR